MSNIGLMIVILLFVLLSAVGLAAFAISFMPGFFSPRRRRVVRITGGLVATPGVLVGIFVVVLSFTLFKEPPTLSQLQHGFASKRQDLERILQMFDEDSHFSRIAPTFLDRDSTGSPGPGRYMENDPNAGLPKARWDAYRKIFSRDGIKLGVQRDRSGDAFIMVDSVGLLNRGHTSGYLYCRPTASMTTNDRFQPCFAHAEKGEHPFDPRTREEGYSFQHLMGAWYAYDEGPS